VRLEQITYHGKLVASLREEFPAYVKKAILERPNSRSQIPSFLEINAEYHDAVLFLDNLLRDAIDAGECRRDYHIDIGKKEIPNYTHFRIFPLKLWHGTQVFCNVRRPTCDYDGCFEGAELLSPVRIKKRRASRLDIGTVGYAFNKEVVLIISARMKRIFESEGITGLTYEPTEYVILPRRVHLFREKEIIGYSCKEDASLNDDPAPGAETPFISRITYSIYRHAADMFLRHGFFGLRQDSPFYCEIHSTLASHFLHFKGLRVPTKEIEGLDFFQIQGVKIQERFCNYDRNEFFISRKALEILLKNKAKGLCRVGRFLRSTFGPMWE
jgi:hypothetical protein